MADDRPPYRGADRPHELERFDDPTEAAKRRQRIPTRPEPRKPAATTKVAVPPPGAGNKAPPSIDLDATQESPPPIEKVGAPWGKAQRPTFRRPSPPPVEDPQPTSADLGAKVVELGDAREELENERALRQEAEAQAIAIKNELRRERRKSSPQVIVEPVPPSDRDKALGKGVRLAAGYLVSLLLAGGAGAGGITLARPAATPEQADATTERVKALEARAAKAEDELTRLRGEKARQGVFNEDVSAWIAMLAKQSQIKARQSDSAPPPVPLSAERMPGDRVKAGPLWRAEEALPEPP